MIGQASTSSSTIAMTELHRRLLLYVALSISKKVKVSWEEVAKKLDTRVATPRGPGTINFSTNTDLDNNVPTKPKPKNLVSRGRTKLKEEDEDGLKTEEQSTLTDAMRLGAVEVKDRGEENLPVTIGGTSNPKNLSREGPREAAEGAGASMPQLSDVDSDLEPALRGGDD